MNTGNVNTACDVRKSDSPKSDQTTLRSNYPRAFRSPFGVFDSSILSDLFRVFDDVTFAENTPSTLAGGSYRSSVPFALNAKNTPDGYTVEAGLPGIKREQVDISVEDGMLTISVNTEDKHAEEKQGYSIREWRSYSGSRSVALPKDADADSITASLNEGVLTVGIKKLPDKQAKKVEIQ